MVHRNRGIVCSGWKHDQRLAALTTPVSRGNRVIVSHLGTMTFEVPAANNQLEEGDCVVVRPP